ncbi:MAG: hypothetical protein QOF72_3037 [Blastocatellia bacterium]|jgi:hypothetical protein|nr:hypothetical protein [Blastocatellia bacterium]
MLVTTGKVSGGAIEVEPGSLPEGATVTILATEDGEVFELNSSDEAMMLAAIAEAERGEVINASEVLRQINNS